jgi:hypothetical protein
MRGFQRIRKCRVGNLCGKRNGAPSQSVPEKPESPIPCVHDTFSMSRLTLVDVAIQTKGEALPVNKDVLSDTASVCSAVSDEDDMTKLRTTLQVMVSVNAEERAGSASSPNPRRTYKKVSASQLVRIACQKLNLCRLQGRLS